nr:M23 family metallopeptidase [uncultured Cetobacterium sp.]
MLQILKRFLLIVLAFIVMLVIVFKPYKEEVVDLNKFTEYYSEEGTIEDGGGVELIESNFYTIEKEYSLSSDIIESVDESLEGVPLSGVDLEKSYEIPKIEKYVVASGDSLSGIADKNGISLEVLKANNPGLSSKLQVGQNINIVKSNGVFYKVKRGDSLFKIALNYKVNIEDLRKYNNLSDDDIRIGQELFIYNPSEESLKRLARGGVSTSRTFGMPVKWAGVTSPFGKRFHPVLKRYIQHAGVDLRAKYVPLMASRGGVVSYVGYMNGYGKIIKINHGNGYETRSAHLNKIYVKKGQRVDEGQVIGQTGMSGRVTGPHLHFEIRKNGRAYNPMNYLSR